MFPYIGQRCREEIERGFADASTRFVVLDAAVMLEAGWNNAVDRIVYVDAPAICGSPASQPAAAGLRPISRPAKPPSGRKM